MTTPHSNCRRFVSTFLEIRLSFSHAPSGCGAARENVNPMRNLSAWRTGFPLPCSSSSNPGLIAQNLGTAPQTNCRRPRTDGRATGRHLAEPDQLGRQMPSSCRAGGAALAAIACFAAGRGFSRWAITAIGLLMVSSPVRLLEFWIQQGTGGILESASLAGAPAPPYPVFSATFGIESHGDSAPPQRPHQDDESTCSIGRGAMPDSGRH